MVGGGVRASERNFFQRVQSLVWAPPKRWKGLNRIGKGGNGVVRTGAKQDRRGW